MVLKKQSKWTIKNITKNKNFLNMQNYVISTDIKNSLLFDYHFFDSNSIAPLALIINFIKKILLFFMRLINKRNGNNLFYYYLIHLLFAILCIPFLKVGLYFYLWILFVITFWFSNINYDFTNSTVYILRIKKSLWNKYFKFSYLSRLVEQIRFSDKVFDNNVQIFLLSLLFTVSTKYIIYFLQIIFLH